MFPLTHALVAQNLLNSAHPRIILGGVFPDLANVIGLHRDVTHEMGEDFYRFCQRQEENLLDFAQGVISHGANPPGLDYYADQSYRGQDQGYCFQRAVPLVERVVETCGIPPHMGLWKAHNFIEMAFDVISVELYPSLTDQFAAALADGAAVKACARILGGYFHIEEEKVETAFLRMPHFFCLTDVTSFHMAEKYALQLEKRHGVKNADPWGMAEVIQEAREMVQGEFTPFINGVLDEMTPFLSLYPR